MEYYSAIKKKEILPFLTTWIGLEDIMLSEISQREKDEYHKISYVESKQINKLIDTENRLAVARNRGQGMGKM